MTFAPGDRVELVFTNDPYTQLRVGDCGTVSGVREVPERTIESTGTTAAAWPSCPALATAFATWPMTKRCRSSTRTDFVLFGKLAIRRRPCLNEPTHQRRPHRYPGLWRHRLQHLPASSSMSAA
jgi:hypothetical protein